MATQDTQEKQDCQEGYAIQLIECVRPTVEERKNLRYVPQLKINQKAQKIIAERFEGPISVIAYVGNMGAGKSKLATMTVAALQNEQHHQASQTFRCGAGNRAVTHGVWMWSEPLKHPNQKPDARGSILILDCEGMGDLDENTGANLYLFCMLISTAFVVVLRPIRIDRYQCERLYQALRRFEHMKAQYVLPNLWLLPLDLPEFVHSDPQTYDDVVISEEQWINNIFTIPEDNPLPNDENEALKKRYEYITRMLPKIKAANIHRLPASLCSNAPNLDVYSLLHSEASHLYTKSIKIAIEKFLANGGKRLLGTIGEHMFVRPSEFATLMGDLIGVMNRDPVPNPDELINQYLHNRFTAEIEKEYLAGFKHDLINYVTQECEKLSQCQTPLTEKQVATIIEQVKQKQIELRKEYIDKIICHTRHEILGLDSTLMSGFQDENQRQRASNRLPALIQHRLNIIETKMSDYHEPRLIIERAKHQLVMQDIRLQAAKTKKLLDDALIIMNLKCEELQREKQIRKSLNRARPWKVGLPPCANCGARGRTYNMLHVDCPSGWNGNLYYYCNEPNQMVCGSCQYVITCDPWNARCTTCQAGIHANKIF